MWRYVGEHRHLQLLFESLRYRLGRVVIRRKDFVFAFGESRHRQNEPALVGEVAFAQLNSTSSVDGLKVPLQFLDHDQFRGGSCASSIEHVVRLDAEERPVVDFRESFAVDELTVEIR